MHNTHYVLDESYVPETDEDIWEFEEMQDFMFIVFKDHLKTKRGQQMISQFRSTRDAWRIYHKLKEHGFTGLTVVCWYFVWI
jgi:hypothetical protein